MTEHQQRSERNESWRGFQAQLLQCWIGEAIARVVERASSSNSSSSRIQSIALVSLLSDQQHEDAAAFATISAFVTQFLKIQHARRYDIGGGDGSAEEDPAIRLHVASVADVGGFEHWLQSHHEQQLSTQDHQQRQQYDPTCLIILYAPLLSADTQEEIAQIVIVTADGGDGGDRNTRMMTRTLLLLINDPIRLMDVQCDRSSSLRAPCCYRFVDSHASTASGASPLSIQSTEQFLVRPLRQLGLQCGLRFVMEIARWTVFKAELGGVAAGTGTGTGTIAELRPPPMLASVLQMPFQLLLLALRWSHFHPALLRAFTKPFERKLGLTPQHRIREAIFQLREQEMALWSHLEGFDDSVGHLMLIPNRRRLSAECEIAIPLGEEDQDESKLKRSLSECQLWDVQKQFYLAQGIKAWSDGIIPFGVSSSSFLAAAYARVAVDFFLETASPNDDNFDSEAPRNCFVWEAASGSCKFLHAFLVHFYQLIDEDHDFARRGLKPCVVASDLSDQVLESRMEMACFQPFLEDCRLEFAHFDTAAFTRGENKKQLFLKHSKRTWHVGRDGPVFLMGNYFLDSLRADVFAVTKSTASPSPPVSMNEVVSVEDAHIKVFEGRVDHQISSIADMELSFQQIDPSTKAAYDDPFVNQVFTDVIESIRSTPASAQPSSLILFPVEAIEFIRTLVDNSTASTDSVQRRRSFSVGIMIGDASFSFRDPIPSAFFNHDDGIEIPQLSPHPDCFCLPVDFEILRLFLQRLSSQSLGATSSAQVASAIATDTFDVLYGRAYPQVDERQAHDDHEDTVEATIQPQAALRPSSTLLPSQVTFAHEFASFTPSDCDLLWGMMGIDDGAVYFSLKTQIALLAQSAWDFDLFVVLQWKLMRLWRRMPPMAVAVTTEPTIDSKYHQQMRLQLIAIANKCWRTCYSLDGDSSKIGEVSQSLSLLQLCRWLYELKAHAEVISLLSESIKTNPSLEVNVSICYLVALAYSNCEDFWQALVYFRKCFALAPKRVKFRRRIAQTLLALQRQKLQAKGS